MKILFMGTPEFAVPSLQRLHEDGHEICAVITQPDKPQGRKMQLVAPPVKVAAQELKIPVFQPETLKNNAISDLLTSCKPDLIAVVAYGKLLPPYILDFPLYGCINIHGSILPKYRGAGPIHWAVINGEEETGVTSMYMAQELDAGDMLMMQTTKIEENETTGELHDRLMYMGADVLSQTVTKLEQGVVQRAPQDHAKSTYAPMLNKEIAQIDWSLAATDIYNKIRGMNPWPTAQTTLHGKVLKIHQARKTVRYSTKPVGTILEASHKTGLFVACGEGTVLEITELQIQGKKRMLVADYLAGNSVEENSKLGL